MNWEHERRVLRHAISLAGAEALHMAANGFKIETKADQSPVTSADLAVNHLLHAHLLGAFPEDGWLSEESPDTDVRLGKQRVWVIDPIDGTSAFIRREPEFCISVALVDDGQPVLAAVFNPSTDELFMATRGGGVQCNDVPMVPTSRQPVERHTIALNPSEQQLGWFHGLDGQVISYPIRSIAWALTLAASGRIDAVATWEPQNEWDLAAGVLLIQEAGGTAVDGAGELLRFNQPDPRYRGLIATSQHCPLFVRRHLQALSPVGP
jgi:myo-inositol-1(or 4)-monophosphatase